MRTLDEMTAIAEAAWKIPCEAVHKAGAPCCVCNPQKTEEGFGNAPYYYLERLALARFDAENARRFGPPIVPRHGPMGPLYAPGQTLKSLASRYMLRGLCKLSGEVDAMMHGARPATAQADGGEW